MPTKIFEIKLIPSSIDQSGFNGQIPRGAGILKTAMCIARNKLTARLVSLQSWAS